MDILTNQSVKRIASPLETPLEKVVLQLRNKNIQMDILTNQNVKRTASPLETPLEKVVLQLRK